MSRIEQSLEKATAMRKEKEAGCDRQLLQEDKGACSEVTEINTDNPYLVTLQDPESAVSEEYQILKSVVKRMTSQDGFNNVIMITSSNRNEGKSLTAMNLAISLSREYDTTALVMEADLREPSLTSYLNIDVKEGWTDYLVGDINLCSAMVRTDIGKLTFLPAGERINDPVECFSSSRMKELIALMKYRYDNRYIIIDAPPVLPFAETRLISGIADATIFVVCEGTTSLDEIRDALEALNGANILGIVYNNARNVGTKRYYHYYKTPHSDKKGKRE